jgi:type I restriction enzyme S subunit
MELKQGYKKTDMGIIPEDWGVKQLKDVCDLTSSKRIFESDYVKIGIPFYRGKEISLLNENKKLDEEYFISAEKYNAINRAFGSPCKGDILITAVGTLGNVYLVPNDDKFYFKDGNLIWLRNIKSVLPSYLSIQLNWLKNEVINNAIGSSQKALTIIVLRKQYFVLPPLSEQTSIANALSDMDALISQTEKLIVKKKAIKQGAMQELLKPKEGWVTKKLGDVAKFLKGSGLPKADLTEDGRYRCIHYGELFTFYKENIHNIKSRTNKNLGAFLSNINDVLMPTSDVTPNGLATASCINENNIVLGGDILVIRTDSNKIDGVFLSYSIKFNRQQIMKLVSGSTVYHLYGSDMSKFIFSFPELKIQQEISRLLIDMEDDINKYQTKLTKLKQQKQGMMHALLTGKIRLVS